MEDPPTIKADECRAFLNKFSSLLLASSDAVGVPEISYSPFVMEDESFFILVSELSKHTGNLRERSRVSAMLSEDEELRMVDALKDNLPKVVVYVDIAIDGKEERRLKNYAPHIYKFLVDRYGFQEMIGLFQILLPKQ